MDKDSNGSDELMSEAHQAIQEILAGDKPKLNRGATELYIQTIINYAQDSEDLTDEEYKTLIAFAEAHVPIASDNMVRREIMNGTIMAAKMAMTNAGGANNISGAKNIAPGADGAIQDIPGSPTGGENIGFMKEAVSPNASGVSSRSQRITKGITP
jgi:hypothetical protein